MAGLFTSCPWVRNLSTCHPPKHHPFQTQPSTLDPSNPLPPWRSRPQPAVSQRVAAARGHWIHLHRLGRGPQRWTVDSGHCLCLQRDSESKREPASYRDRHIKAIGPASLFVSALQTTISHTIPPLHPSTHEQGPPCRSQRSTFDGFSSASASASSLREDLAAQKRAIYQSGWGQRGLCRLDHHPPFTTVCTCTSRRSLSRMHSFLKITQSQSVALQSRAQIRA